MELYFSGRIEAGALLRGRNEVDTIAEELTGRERDVPGLLATQMSRRGLYRKLGVENRSAAVSRARELGLL